MKDRLWSVSIGRWNINFAWVELYTDGAPVSHQCYGLYIESGHECNPLLAYHCKP